MRGSECARLLLVGLFCAAVARSAAAVADPPPVAAAAPPRALELRFEEPILRRALPETERRLPVVIYYAVDTPESFMQVSVDYELRVLRGICARNAGDPRVNWVAFVNSHYVSGSQAPAGAGPRTFVWCRAGDYRVEKLWTSDVARRIEWLTRYDPRALAQPPPQDEYLFQRDATPAGMVEMYARYPLADVEVMRRLLAFARTELFPGDDYRFFLHVKSHGSLPGVNSGPVLSAAATADPF